MEISAKLKKIVSSHPIGKALMELDGSRFNYLDATVNEGKVQFTALPSNVLMIDKKTVYQMSTRQILKLGAFVNKNLTGFNENQVREFVETVSAQIDGDGIKVVSGEEIRKAYNSDNYVVADSDGGGHANIRSCMSSPAVGFKLDFYVYNEPHIKLAVAYKDGLVAGRAVLFETYFSKDDFDKRKNSKLLLGRQYAVRNQYQTLLRKWGQENTDGRLEGQTFYDWTGHSKTIENFYVPLKHALLNYYPYADHFQSVDLDISALVGGQPKHKNWVGVSRDNPHYPDGKVVSVLDPFRPKQAYINYPGIGYRWVSIDKARYSEKEGKWLDKSHFLYCDICKTEEYIGSNIAAKRLKDGRTVCKLHKIVTTFDGHQLLAEEADKCGSCNTYALKGTFDTEGCCKACIASTDTCTQCETRQHKNFFITTGGGDMCLSCARKAKYEYCSECKKVELPSHTCKAKKAIGSTLKVVVESKTSKSTYVDTETTTTYEKVVTGSRIPISGNAIRIVGR